MTGAPTHGNGVERAGKTPAGGLRGEVPSSAALKVVNPATTRLAEAVPQPESRTGGGSRRVY